MRKIKVVLVVIALAVSALSAHYVLAQENTTEEPAIAPEKTVDVTAITPCVQPVCNMVCTNTVCTNTPFCDRLAKELNLTDEQLVKLKEILAENRSMCRAQRGMGQGMRGNRGGRGLNPDCPMAKRQAIPAGKFQRGNRGKGMSGNPDCCLMNPDCPNIQKGQGKGHGMGNGRGNGKGMKMDRAGNCPMNNGKAMRSNRLGKNRNAGLCPNGNATQPIIINIYTDENKVTRVK